jgi:uncharacterized protein YjbI with pentapeptide repeats
MPLSYITNNDSKTGYPNCSGLYTIAKDSDQFISSPSLSNFNIPPQNYAGSPITVGITQPNSNSGGAFSYSSSNSNIATVSSSNVTFLTLGSFIITETHAASGGYSQGSIQTTVTVQLQAGITSFEGANFVGANLSKLDLSKFDFKNSNFTSANLTSANLTNANLTNANLTSANMYQVSMNNSDLTNANLTSANLLGTIGYWMIEPTPVNLDKAVAITQSGVNYGTGWTFLREGGAWYLNNNNLPS